MHYEYGGQIEVWDVPNGVDAIREAINKMVEEDWECDEYLSKLEFTNYYHNRMDGSGFSGDYDDMTGMSGFFYDVSKTIMELYPNCSMDSHFCGTNMSSGTETVTTIQLRNRHVRELDFEFCDERLECPNEDCDCGFVSLGEVEFDRDYICDECGEHISAEQVYEMLADCLNEYDLENDESEEIGSAGEPFKKIELDLAAKKVVTTGLSAEDERWVKEQVESRGGEYKPKFVVSLDYLIYNPNYDHETVKYTKAKEQIEKGRPVQIITFDDFKRSL